MNMFFVYKGDLSANLYIDKLTRLAGAQIIAAFPSRKQAVNYALGIVSEDECVRVFKKPDNSFVVVEREFLLKDGDGNNLISEYEWEMAIAEEPEQKTPQEPPDEPLQLTGTVNIAGKPVFGNLLSAETNNLSGNGAIHYQWARSDDGTLFTDIENANSDYYVLTGHDVGKYIAVSVAREDTVGTLNSSITDIIQDI